MESYTSPAAISTKVTSSMTKERAMERFFGLMDRSTKGTGRMEFKMVKGRSTFLAVRSSVASSKTVSLCR